MNLKDDKQQNTQLDFAVAPTSEAREVGREETESSGARNESEKPASTDRMMEAICEWEKPEGSHVASQGQQRQRGDRRHDRG
jgi:hypothetical protein